MLRLLFERVLFVSKRLFFKTAELRHLRILLLLKEYLKQCLEKHKKTKGNKNTSVVKFTPSMVTIEVSELHTLLCDLDEDRRLPDDYVFKTELEAYKDYKTFIELFVRGAVGIRLFEEMKWRLKLSAFVSTQDEAFVLVVLENNWARWLDMAVKGNWKESNVPSKYTHELTKDGEILQIKWGEKGRNAHKYYLKYVEKLRASRTYKHFEKIYLQEQRKTRKTKGNGDQKKEDTEETRVPRSALGSSVSNLKELLKATEKSYLEEEEEEETKIKGEEEDDDGHDYHNNREESSSEDDDDDDDDLAQREYDD